MVRIDKIQRTGQNLIKSAARHSQPVQVISRELQMVPKYLECAKAKSGDLYRFNSKQIDDITAACKRYETHLPLTDVVKELLAVGSEGNCRQLSAEEMIGFFRATSGMKQLEQKNVLRFIKVAQEDIPAKITPEYLKKEHPYEMYRDTTIMMEMQHPQNVKSHPELISEEHIKESYENFILYQYRIEADPNYSAYTKTKKYPFINYIKDNNKEVVNTIARNTNPEALYDVLKAAGVSKNSLEASNDLVTLYTMSNKNKFLVKDISRVFFPDEIKAITALLKQELTRNGEKLRKYYQFSASSTTPLDLGRSSVMYLLDLKGKLKIHKIKAEDVQDVYPDNRFGNIRGRKIAGGNYERGKKK